MKKLVGILDRSLSDLRDDIVDGSCKDDDEGAVFAPSSAGALEDASERAISPLLEDVESSETTFAAAMVVQVLWIGVLGLPKQIYLLQTTMTQAALCAVVFLLLFFLLHLVCSQPRQLRRAEMRFQNHDFM